VNDSVASLDIELDDFWFLAIGIPGTLLINVSLAVLANGAAELSAFHPQQIGTVALQVSF